MENYFGVDGGEFNLNDLISELLQGRDAANRLHMVLNNNNNNNNNAPLSSSSSSQDCLEVVLVDKVTSSLDNALCMLNHAGLRNESSDSDHELRDASGRRRKAPVWTDQVIVSPGEGLEEAHDDGYNWRKYGQKRIIGAEFPKGYYRCSHLYSQGCLAKKEIQKSDDDPTVFNVRYRGTHTCNPSPLPSPLPLRPQPQPQPATVVLENQEQPSTVQIQQEDNLLNLRRNLKVTIENSHSHGHESPFPSSNYDFASSSGSCFKMSPTTTPHVENLGGSQFQFVPTTSGVVETIMEIPTATTSGTNSPVVSMGFPFDAIMGFDFNFTFDNNSNHPGFFD